MIVHLLRHGDCGPDDGRRTGGQRDPELSGTGAWQAEALGARLRRCGPIEALYTSDLRRAVQTAEILVKALGVTVSVDPRFREIHMGVLEDKSWEVVREEYPAFDSAWTSHQTDVPYPQGESGADVWHRAGEAIDEIVHQHTGTVAVVTHGGVIMALLSGYLGMDLNKRFGFRIDTCSISTVEYDEPAGGFTVICVNDTAHLESLTR